MPASLYRLVGKQHHTEPIVNEPESTPITFQPEDFKAPQVEETSVLDSFANQSENNDVSSTLAEEDITPASVDSEDEESSPEETPTWDASWTKTQLLAVAKEIGLNVSVLNTKTEILAALSSAK